MSARADLAVVTGKVLAAMEAVESLERAIAVARPEDLPAIAGQLWRLDKLLTQRLTVPVRIEEPEDRILEVEEVAKRFGQSKSWVYAHAAKGEFREFTLPTSGRLKFSERGLEKYLRRRGA